MSSFYLRKYDVFSWTENRRGLFELSNDFTAILTDNGVAKFSGQIDLLIKMKEA